ncbi:hypothetical protein MKW94_003972, partial [Papaver nudicaule]|nr:hypothetical protein [Papaver nudicaule]
IFCFKNKNLPNEDLDALILIKSDELLFNVIESFLSPSSSSKSVKRIPPIDTSSMGDGGSLSAVGSSSPPLTGKTVVLPYPTVHYYYENHLYHHHQGNNTSSNNNRAQY